MRRLGRTLQAWTCAIGILAAAQAEGATCAITRLVGVNFGGYDSLGSAPLDSTGTIGVTCSGVQATDTITIDLGSGGAASFTPRELASGAERLGYNLYLDAARTQVWGDGFSGTGHLGPMTPLDGVESVFTVYGRIPGGQNVAAGAYADTIVVTLHF